MTSQPSYQTIATDILPNISRSKGNQKIKFDQLQPLKFASALDNCRGCPKGNLYFL